MRQLIVPGRKLGLEVWYVLLFDETGVSYSTFLSEAGARHFVVLQLRKWKEIKS